jgi:hypothetical protein
MRKGRDLHWCRHDEIYRRGKQLAHLSCWTLAQQNHAGEHQGRRPAVEIGHLSRDGVAQRRANRCAALIARMYKDRQWLLGQIASCSSSRRDAWHRKLDQVEPTAAGAEAALDELRDDIERERLKLASAPLRGWSQPSCAEPPELSWPTLGTLRLQLSLLGLDGVASGQKEADADLETHRAQCESTLALIVSRMHALASPVRCYQAGTF